MDFKSFTDYYYTNSKIWDCSLDIAIWFSRMNFYKEQKKLIATILIEKLSAIERGENVPVVGLQTHMLITEREYYLRVLNLLQKHIMFVRSHGFSLDYSTHLAINLMCNYYYHHNNFISMMITEALENNEL